METEGPGFVSREIQVIGNEGTQNLTMFHYTEWPDKSVPGNVRGLEKLVDRISKEEEKKQPIIVHCSAGVGRTGTFLALTQLKYIIEYQKNKNLDFGVSVFSIVRRLREQRMHMVEKLEQYELIHEFVEKWVNKDKTFPI
jgi:protein tyrosine phosphatase